MRIFLIVFISCLVNSSCKNFYTEMASKDTDAAVLYAARLALAEGDWDAAITQFGLLSAATLTETEVVIDRASAYSGRCGLDFLDLADLIQNIGITPLMELLSDNYVVTAATNTADCFIAETLLKTVADVNGVVSTERGQFLMAFNSLAKIGTILNFYSDVNDNGTPDPGWNACDPVTGPTDIPNSDPVNHADVSEIGTAIVLFYRNLQGTSFGTAITAPIGTLCTAIDGTIYDFCDVITTAGITADHRKALRALIVETTDGIGLQIAAGGTAANAPTCP